MTSAPPAAGRARALLALVAASTALRLWVALVMPPTLYPTGSVLAEEQWRGSAALELLQGPLVPFLDLQGVPFHGGPLVVALLAAPLYAVFGSSLFVLKLVPLAFNAVAVALAFVILDRHAGRRAAWFGGALFAIGPPGYALLSTVAYGTHVECGALSLALVALVLADEQPGPGRAFATGVLAGFATYFDYVAALTWSALLVRELVRDRRAWTAKRFWIRAAGFLVGMLPWFTYNLRHGFIGLEVYETSMAQRVASSLAEVGASTPRLPGDAAAALYLLEGRGAAALAGLCLLAAVGLAARRRTPVTLFVLQPLLFVAFYLASGLRVGTLPAQGLHEYRYFAIPWPFLAMAAGIGLDVVATRSWVGRTSAYAATAALCTAFVAGVYALSVPGDPASSRRTEGHLDERLGNYIAVMTRGDTERLAHVIERAGSRGENERDLLFFTLGQTLRASAQPSPRRPNPERVARFEGVLDFLRERVAERYQPYFERPGPHENLYVSGTAGRMLFWESRGGRPPATMAE